MIPLDSGIIKKSCTENQHKLTIFHTYIEINKRKEVYQMNKREVLTQLFQEFCEDIDVFTVFDDYVKTDLQLSETDDSPIIESNYSDGYSSIDRTDNPGAYTLESLLRSQSSEEDYSGTITELLLSLMLNRELTPYEKGLADDMSAMCNYAADQDRELNRLICSIRADDNWNDYFLLPAQVCLFLIKGKQDEIADFWQEVKEIMNESLKIAGIVSMHTGIEH